MGVLLIHHRKQGTVFLHPDKSSPRHLPHTGLVVCVCWKDRHADFKSIPCCLHLSKVWLCFIVAHHEICVNTHTSPIWRPVLSIAGSNVENKWLFLLNSDPNDHHCNDLHQRNWHSTGALGHPWQVFILDLLRPEGAVDFPEESTVEGIGLFHAVGCHSAGSPSHPTALISQCCSSVFYSSINHCWHSQVIVIRFKEKMARIVFWFLFGSRKWQKSHINKPILLFSLCLTTQT